MNSTRTPRKTSRILPALTLLCLAAVSALLFMPVWGSWRKHTPELNASQLTPVRRTSMDVKVRAGGELESVQKTLIEC